MKLYSCKAVEDLIERYENKGGAVHTLQWGVLGYGLTVCTGEGLKTAVITEIPLGEWQSAHKIRFYNKTPKKYAASIARLPCDRW